MLGELTDQQLVAVYHVVALMGLVIYISRELAFDLKKRELTDELQQRDLTIAQCKSIICQLAYQSSQNTRRHPSDPHDPNVINLATWKTKERRRRA